jgi:hypothetical protein
MAQKYFEDQLDGEEMLLLFRKHPVVMRRELIFASVLLLLGTLPSFVRPEYSYFFGGLGIGFLLAFLVMFYAWIGWHFSVYIVTDKRMIQIKQKGFFHRSLVDISLDQVTMVNYEVKGLQETLLGFGTITVQTYVGELVIRDVHKPRKIQKEITSLLRERGYLQGSNPYTTSPEEQNT